jgi:hypothetical protein
MTQSGVPRHPPCKLSPTSYGRIDAYSAFVLLCVLLSVCQVEWAWLHRGLGIKVLSRRGNSVIYWRVRRIHKMEQSGNIVKESKGEAYANNRGE